MGGETCRYERRKNTLDDLWKKIEGWKIRDSAIDTWESVSK